MKLRECFRRRNNPRRVSDGNEKPAKRADQVGAGDGVSGSAVVATVGKEVTTNNPLSFRSYVPVIYADM